jgi:hypothetical protein
VPWLWNPNPTSPHIGARDHMLAEAVSVELPYEKWLVYRTLSMFLPMQILKKILVN